MELPEYVSKSEVRRICKDLGLRDWTKIDPKKPGITGREGKVILKNLGKNGMKIDIRQFCKGLEVELEHGMMFEAYNVTNNHPILTGKIVMAHLMETLDYYMRLDVAEIEGDLLKAIATKDPAKGLKYYRKLVTAKSALTKAEGKVLS